MESFHGFAIAHRDHEPPLTRPSAFAKATEDKSATLSPSDGEREGVRGRRAGSWGRVTVRRNAARSVSRRRSRQLHSLAELIFHSLVTQTTLILSSLLSSFAKPPARMFSCRGFNSPVR